MLAELNHVTHEKQIAASATQSKSKEVSQLLHLIGSYESDMTSLEADNEQISMALQSKKAELEEASRSAKEEQAVYEVAWSEVAMLRERLVA